MSEPRTKAGRELLDYLAMMRHEGRAWDTEKELRDEVTDDILAIEHEAGAAPLDVERLAQAQAEHGLAVRDHEGAWDVDLELAEKVAATYARLSERTDR